MDKAVEYVIIGLLTIYAVKKKFFDVKKSEYDTLARALEVFRDYTDRLTDRVNLLKDEVEALKQENLNLSNTINQLQELLKSTKNDK